MILFFCYGNMNMKQFPISFTQKKYEKLKKRSMISGCSISSIVRSVLTDHFFEQEDMDAF
jgi:hypothetical protein